MPFFRKKPIETRLVGPNLVAAFHNANPPLVWKFDLDRNHSFTVALQGEDGDWELGITSPKGEFYPVAHFLVRENAEEALASVQKILMKKRCSKVWSVIRFLLILIVVAGLLLVAGGYLMATGFSRMGFLMPSLSAGSPPAAPSAMIPSGVPVPADQFLQAPR